MASIESVAKIDDLEYDKLVDEVQEIEPKQNSVNRLYDFDQQLIEVKVEHLKWLQATGSRQGFLVELKIKLVDEEKILFGYGRAKKIAKNMAAFNALQCCEQTVDKILVSLYFYVS